MVYLILGLLMAAAGGAYLWMALRDGFASDKAGRVVARRATQPAAYWAQVTLFALLLAMGVALVVIAAVG